MINLKLDENYTIVSDSNNFTLEYKNTYFDTEKEKEVKQNDEWHYPNLRGALKKYLNQSLKQDDSIDLVIKRLDYIEQMINNIDTYFID